MAKVTLTVEGEADEIRDALTMLIGQGFGEEFSVSPAGMAEAGPQARTKPPWTETEVTRLWEGLSPKAQRILAEVATRPDGYPTAALAEAVGLSTREIGSSLSSVGHNMRRLFREGDAYLKEWPLDNDLARRRYTMPPEVAATIQNLAAKQAMSALGIAGSDDGR